MFSFSVQPAVKAESIISVFAYMSIHVATDD